MGEDEGEGVIAKSTLTPTLSRQRERETRITTDFLGVHF